MEKCSKIDKLNKKNSEFVNPRPDETVHASGGEGQGRLGEREVRGRGARGREESGA